MQYRQKLISGQLIKRYKRFLADVQLDDGSHVTVHCPNPGAMMGIKDPGMTVWLQGIPPEKRKKLDYTWELVEIDGNFVGVNTQHPNRLVKDALEQKRIEPFQSYDRIRPEVKIDNGTRIDFLLEKEGAVPFYLEVKNVHWKQGDWAVFPDCVTKRGTKHLHALMSLVDQGYRAGMLYVVQRSDCRGVTLAHDIDPDYANAACKALEKGVEVWAYNCSLSQTEIHLHRALEYHTRKDRI